MIKMIKGNYGLVKNGQVVAMDKYSDPFAIDPQKEADLIASGFAKKVDAPAKPEAKKEDAQKVATQPKTAEVKKASQTAEPKNKTDDVKKDVK